MKQSIYKQAVEQMNTGEINFHESDLYLKCTEVSENLVKGYAYKQNVTKFRNNIDGLVWFDIPFAYSPFWDKKRY